MVSNLLAKRRGATFMHVLRWSRCIFIVSDGFGDGISADAHVHITGPMVRHLLSPEIQIDDWTSENRHRDHLAPRFAPW